MYLPHKHGLYSNSSIISSSSSTINKMLYGGASFVPIAVPRFCFSVFFPNVNMLLFNTTSAKSIMVSVDPYFSFLVIIQSNCISTCDVNRGYYILLLSFFVLLLFVCCCCYLGFFLGIAI